MTRRHVTWLLVVDLHLRSRSDSQWVLIKRAVMDDIRAHRKLNSAASYPRAGRVLIPDLIFLPGDLADHGKPEEYETVADFVRELWEATRLGKDRTFPGLGNHDIDRASVTGDYLYRKAHEALANPKHTEESLAVELRDFWPRRELFWKKFDPFVRFAEAYSAVTPQQTYFVHPVELPNAGIVHVVGLNSAWMSERSDEDERRELILGGPQLNEIEALLPSSRQFLQIAMMHHPEDALHPADPSFIRLTKQCQIVLSGHVHKPRLVHHGELGREHVHVTGGAMYERSGVRNPSFSYGTVDLASGEIHVFARMVTDAFECVPDSITYSEAPDGHWSARLPNVLHDPRRVFSPVVDVKAGDSSSGVERSGYQAGMALVARFEDPAPLDLVEETLRYVGIESPEVVLEEWRQVGLVTEQGGFLAPTPEARDAWLTERPQLLVAMVNRASEWYIDFLRRYSGDDLKLDSQFRNIWYTFDWSRSSRRYMRAVEFFVPLEKHLKWRGERLRLWRFSKSVIRCAERIPAPVPPEVLKVQARALICGVVWVLIRLGRLDEAVSAAREGERISSIIHDKEGLAYVHKCLGNLERIRGDFMKSEELLRGAIDEFTYLKGASSMEVADCKVLLARLFLENKQRRLAKEILDETFDQLSRHPESKEFVEWNLRMSEVCSDLEAAIAHLRSAVSSVPQAATERGSELYAEAHMLLGSRVKRRNPAEACSLFGVAKDQFSKLGDEESMAEAQLEIEEIAVETDGDPLAKRVFRTLKRVGRQMPRTVVLDAWTRYKDQPRRKEPSRAFRRSTLEKTCGRLLEIAREELNRAHDPFR